MNAINAWNAPEREVPWPLIITGMFFNNLYWWCTNQSFVQRSLAAKSLKEGQKGAIFCGFLKCLGPLYLVSAGHHRILSAVHPGKARSCRLLRDRLSLIRLSFLRSSPKPVMGFFAAVHVRRDPVLVQLGAQLRIDHVYPRPVPFVHQSEGFGHQSASRSAGSTAPSQAASRLLSLRSLCTPAASPRS